MNLPNSLTLTRIMLVPLFLAVVLARFPYEGLVAAGIFVIAAATDGFDGYLARKHRLVTRLGQFLDPLADKLLISAALIALVEKGHLTTWVAMIIIGREMAVTGLRAIAAADGLVIAAGPWGKAKTVLQISFVLDAILEDSLVRIAWFHHIAVWLYTPLLWIMVALTIWSGIDYGLGYRRVLMDVDPPAKKPLKFRFRLRSRRKSLTDKR